ncbi:MAG: diaminopimelate epimerase [Alphaproteobacteria bacterium]|nr:MAG: diaminopimelate epimerase [Alphaproteobacteria bacterium]
MTIPFVRMHGAGNDFVLIDDRAGRLHPQRSALAKAVCRRRTGLGGDGLILIGRAPDGSAADFAMTYVNADGNDGEMCGNGARCAARRAAELGLVRDRGAFATPAGLIRASISGSHVTLGMTDPVDERPAITLEVDGRAFELWYIDTGVPHVVTFVDDLDDLDVETVGRRLRHHPAFAPRGVNANFAEPAGPSRLRARTYERGVEAETLACGTGAVAIALVAFRRGLAASPVTIVPPGGELVIGFRTDIDARFRDVTLSGPTERIAIGEIDDGWLAAHGLESLTAAAA